MMIRLLGRVIKTVFGLIFLFIVLLPTLLLPVVTAVPKSVWISLWGLILVCLVLAYFWRRKAPCWLILSVGSLFISCFSIIASQFLAATPIIRNRGQTVPGSIAQLEQVTLNGSRQWITIRGQNRAKSILLYLGIGGPGAGGFPATATSLSPLEKHFVVVNWDQPGTGKSYKARDIKTLTPQIVVDDAYALTQLLRKRFHQPKIYVMGLSWGTIVGIKLVQQHPELFYAYLGNGQMVNTVENDRFGYHLALELLEKKAQKNTLAKLKSYGPPPYHGQSLALKYADYNNVLFDYMGSPNLWMIMILVPQFAREYGYVDKINFARGLVESFTVLYPQLENLDFSKQASKLEVPVFFLVGKKDVNAVSSIVERYYNILEAPYKQLIWVKSGHGATAEEITQAFVNKVLVQAPPR